MKNKKIKYLLICILIFNILTIFLILGDLYRYTSKYIEFKQDGSIYLDYDPELVYNNCELEVPYGEVYCEDSTTIIPEVYSETLSWKQYVNKNFSVDLFFILKFLLFGTLAGLIFWKFTYNKLEQKI